MCDCVWERERALERNLPVAQGQLRLRCLQAHWACDYNCYIYDYRIVSCCISRLSDSEQERASECKSETANARECQHKYSVSVCAKGSINWILQLK